MLKTKNQRKIVWSLFLDFMKFSCFCFGGGWSIVAQMQQKYVEKENRLTAEELIDLTSVAKSLPGLMIGNVAMLYGYREAGLPGGIVSSLAMVTPPMMILTVISFGYQAFRTNYWVSAAMSGMQAAVVPIVASAALGLIKGAFKVPPCYVVMAVSLAAYLMLDISPILLIVFGVIAGLLISGWYERKGGIEHGAS